MVPRLEQRLLHEIVRALLVAAERYGKRAKIAHLAYEGVSQALRDFAPQSICLRFARGLSKAGADDRGLALARLRRTQPARGGRYGPADWGTNLFRRRVRPAAVAASLLEPFCCFRPAFFRRRPCFSLPGPQSSPIRLGIAVKTADLLHASRVQKRAQPQLVPGVPGNRFGPMQRFSALLRCGFHCQH